MARRLFCELSPWAYSLSVKKGIFLRRSRDFVSSLFGRTRFARRRETEPLPVIVKSHTSPVLRKLHGVDMKLQENKAKNLELAAEKLNGLILSPGETFSFWRTVGIADKKHGYLEGLVISKDGLRSDWGGGLCQMANMIHWLVLNSPLTVTELHHHTDALFPDDRRRVPFGTGTSVFYNYVDYRVRNDTGDRFQFLLWLEDGTLCGELRCDRTLPYRWKLTEENHHFRREGEKMFRISQVYRTVIDRETGEEVKKELILDNHSEVMYDYALIPPEQIRNEP
ncbi:MAG: VanW family protein [Clostridia bacterium]|nr:VanW family protein [Clostridia bacterium]